MSNKSPLRPSLAARSARSIEADAACCLSTGARISVTDFAISNASTVHGRRPIKSPRVLSARTVVESGAYYKPLEHCQSLCAYAAAQQLLGILTQSRFAERDHLPLGSPITTPSKSPVKPLTAAIPSLLKKSLRPHENIYNLPNFLTVTRLFAAPATAYLILHSQHTAALALFTYAGITDLVDGYLARKWKVQTVAGSVMDPMADKALMIVVTVTLAIKGALPLYLATLILGRDGCLALAAIYYRYASLPSPKTFTRYWDFSLPSAEVHPTTVSKYNTFLQLVLIGATMALPVLTAHSHHLGIMHDLGLGGLDVHQGMMYFQWLVAGTTAWSGLSYAFLKNAVTILGEDEALKAKQGARGRAIIGVVFGGVVLASIYLAGTVDEQKREVEAVAEEPEKST